jgi:PAS domain S-box-containing protein
MSTSVFYVAPLLAAALLCGGLAGMAVPHRAVPGMRWFMIFMGILVVWTLGYAAEMAVPGLEGKVVAARVQYLAIAFVGIAWLAFTTEHSGLSWWTPRNLLLALVVPAATPLMVWTNDFHGLVWSDVTLAQGPGYTVLDLERGLWFWVVAAYSYLCLVVALALLLHTIVTRGSLFRRQATLLFLASLPPLAGNALYLGGFTDVDLTVFGFTASGLLAGWAALRWRLLSIGPVARDTIVEAMPDPMVVLDPRSAVVDVNPAALRLLGATADSVIGRPAAEVLGPFAPELAGADGRVRRTVVGGPGGRGWDCELNPLLDPKGRPRGWTLVMHDVTDREAEAGALRRAREVAEDTALAQRAFLSNMNHELRTPLNGVMGMLEVLLDSGLTREQESFVRLARESAEELLALVDRVMDFSAVGAGRVELARVLFDPSAVLRRTVGKFQDGAAAKGLALRLEMGPEVPHRALGDEFRVEQILVSLVDNAVKFTDAGAVEIRAAAPGRGPDGVTLAVEVRDTGVGIPPDRLDAIFRGFVQVDTSTTRRHGGAGLGLALAHRLVTRMGGRIEVSSEAGRGSSFRFEVPLEAAGPGVGG